MRSPRPPIVIDEACQRVGCVLYIISHVVSVDVSQLSPLRVSRTFSPCAPLNKYLPENQKNLKKYQKTCILLGTPSASCAVSRPSSLPFVVINQKHPHFPSEAAPPPFAILFFVAPFPSSFNLSPPTFHFPLKGHLFFPHTEHNRRDQFRSHRGTLSLRVA